VPWPPPDSGRGLAGGADQGQSAPARGRIAARELVEHGRTEPAARALGRRGSTPPLPGCNAPARGDRAHARRDRDSRDAGTRRRGFCSAPLAGHRVAARDQCRPCSDRSSACRDPTDSAGGSAASRAHVRASRAHVRTTRCHVRATGVRSAPTLGPGCIGGVGGACPRSGSGGSTCRAGAHGVELSALTPGDSLDTTRDRAAPTTLRAVAATPGTRTDSLKASCDARSSAVA
jgi:hypothetical protein